MWNNVLTADFLFFYEKYEDAEDILKGNIILSYSLEHMSQCGRSQVVELFLFFLLCINFIINTT